MTMFANSENKKPLRQLTICVVGLGYVGTPLAEAFAKHLPTIGFDIDQRKTESNEQKEI